MKQRILTILTLLLCFAFTSVNAQGEYNATTMGAKVVEMETAAWGQSAPYNNLCPTIGTNRALTGCGPTAFAILCHYYKWPKCGSGSVTHNNETLDLSTHNYDYENMLSSYSGEYSEVQATAVATLMRDLGYAAKVTYGTSATGFSESINALKNFFSFNNSLFQAPSVGQNSLYRTDVEKEDPDGFKRQLKECLSQGYPILFTSLVNDNNPNTEDGRHIFILDGYTENDYFHFNFGWNGYGNGWYDLDNVRPDNTSDYSTQQRAFLYVIPTREKYAVTASVSPAGAGTVTVNGNANSAQVMEGTYATLVATANGGYTFQNWTKGGEVVSTNKSCTVKVASSDNDYVANFLTVGNTTVNVSVTYNSSYGTVAGTSGTVANGTTLTPRLNEEVTLTATPLDGYVFNGWTVTKGTNSTNYAESELTLVATEDMSVTANFALAETDYIIDNTTGTTLTTDRVNNWEHNAIKLTLSTDDVGIAYNGYISLFAGASGSKTYTLTAPTGYTITKYKFSQCRSQSTSSTYNLSIVADAEYPLTTSDQDITISNVNAATAQFTVKGDAGRSMYTKQIIVTLKKDGAGGGSTPPSTQYTITATANPGTAGSVTGGGTYTEGANVTLTATPNSGYEFVNWTKGGIEVSTNATYSFTANANADYVANFEPEVQDELTTGYYHLVSRATSSHEYLYNNALRTNNSKKYTLQSDSKITTNNGIWYITVNSNQLGVKNGDGNALVTGAAYCGNATTHNTLNIEKTTDVDDVTYYSFVEGINCTNRTQYNFTLEGGYSVNASDNNYVATWTGHPDDQANQWRLEPVDMDGMNVYNVVVECTEQDVYVVYGSGTNEEYAFDGGFFITDATITAQQLTAKKGNDAVQDVTISVEGNTIRVLEEVIPSNEQTLNVTFNNATYTKTDGTELTSGWGYQVVTQTTPAVTIKVAETINNFGYTTGVINGVKTPYLYKNTNFILSISEQYKITGYRITVRGQDNSYSGDFTCSVGGNETSKATLSGTTTQTLSATGLDTNIINISVGGTSGNGIFITALEITYVENEFEPAMFKAEIEGWRDNNPNTHLGTITIGGTAMKLTPAHQTASELTMPVVEGTVLAFTRKYRGFEFNGFYIGSTELGTNPTLTAENVAAIDENNPLIAKFTATDDVTLFYDDDEFSYRIPAIAKTGTNRLVAVSDYRHSHDDIGRDNHGTGTLRVDLVMRTSDDNGLTWSAKQTIAEGNQNFGYGDAAVVANGENILVMAVAGNVFFTNANATNKQRTYRIYSSDNGATWNKEEVSDNLYTLFPDGYGMFFGSGKLVVDPNFNNSGNARVYGAVLLNDGNNYVVYSDDWGSTWNILGGGAAASANEPKVEILPNGQILLSARRGGGRTCNVFTYTDKANNAGTWSTATNGCDNGGNSTNGEIICLDAKKPNGKPTKILLQSQPYGSDRRNVSIWYKEIDANETYTASSIASDWTMGKQVSTQLSAYSAMCLQANGEIALFFEEAPCHNDDYTYGYSMVYVPLTIEEITNDNFLNPNADVEYVPVEFNIVLTDTQGNEYRETLDYIPGDVAAVESYLTTTYPFITLGTTGAIADNTYTNTVTLPFKVSNANTTVWHNIYWPANGTSQGQFYPIYMMANADNATNVAKISEQVHYGNSQYNTYNYADKLGWAVYNVNNSFTFKFKNKLTGKFMAVNGVVSSDNASNVIYTDETNATVFTLTKNPGTNDNWKGDFAITSVYNGTTGYVCNTSAGYAYATNYTSNTHPGAWAKIVESPDYWTIYEQLLADINNFGAGDGKYTENDDINNIDIDALASMPINSLNTKAEEVQTVKDSYTEITLTVPAVNDIVPGSVKILDELVSHKFVPKGNVTIQAIPAAGYRFVNWTRPAAEPQASAAARTVAARESNVVSTDNPYTVTVSEALSLEANFEPIVVTATLTDAQDNTYIVEVDGFTEEVTKASVATKLTEKYPFIVLGNNDHNITLSGSGTAYTYTNTVVLPFKVNNSEDIYMHNIYWLQGNDYPVYISGLNGTDTYVSKVTGDYAYGDHPTYNTFDGNSKISWAIYSVNNSFEFIFKNENTGMYMQVTDVAATNAQNTKFVERANATTFTLIKGDGEGLYALTANINDTPGYLCSTETAYGFTTFSNNINYAWLKFTEPDYLSKLLDIDQIFYPLFANGNGKCIVTEEIQAIKDDVDDGCGDMTLNTIISYINTTNYVIENWPTIKLNITPENSGTTAINGEEGVTTKRAPADYQIPIAATPATGYHFVNWTGTDYESTDAATTVTISGGKGVVTEFTANFAINTYNINVTAEGNGVANTNAATVEHGGEVTLTAEANDGYVFAGWYNDEEFVSAEATYTFTVTSNINYTARFNEAAAGTVAIHITVASTDDTTVTNAVDGNVKAIIDGIGQEWATDADVTVGADVQLVAINDYNLQAYLFDGWYKDSELVSNDLEITVKATEVATYEARFFRGCVVTGEPKSNSSGYVTSITLADGTSLGYDAGNRAVVKKGTEVKINTWLRYGYETTWKDENENIVGYEQNLVITIEKDVTYTATFEPVTYTLTVRANDDSYGIVSAESLAGGNGEEIIVGHNMEATITATAKPGYRFVKWTTTDDTHVSYEKSYTVPAIQNVEDMVDVEYVAVFEEKENAPAGKYYRFAYEFPAPAQSVATRAGEELVYEISPSTGTPNTNGGFFAYWVSNNNPQLRMDSKANSGNEHEKINTLSNVSKHSLVDGTGSGVVFTVSAPDGYVITGYSISGVAYGDITLNGSPISHNESVSLSDSNLEVSSFSFTIVGGKRNTYNTGVDISSFEVTIVAVAPNTARYYIQSTPVSGTNNAMVMTTDTTAASVFYYAESKLMSYANGKFVKEDGDTRGLQAYGAEAGVVTITENGDGTATIAAPSYMHAYATNDNYYVNHCSSNDGTYADAEHNFIIEEVTSLPVTISAVGYATFYAPVAVKVPTGVTAYYLADDGIQKGTGINYASMTPIEGKNEAPAVIPAYTGVVLEAAEAETYYFDITETDDEINSLLDGTVEATYVEGDAYVLSAPNGELGFYKAKKNALNNKVLNNSHKSYLPASIVNDVLQGSAGFRLVFGTTAIEEVEAESEVEGIYDLSGRKLEGIYSPGVYIVNGKKVLVK